MKEQITSAIRHALTFLPALGVFLVSKGWLEPAEGVALDKELAELLSVAAGLAGAAISRLIMFAIARFAPHLRGIFGGSSGGTLPLWAMTAAAWGAFSLVVGLSMSACVVGVDERGGWSVRPDPLTVDAGLKYLIRHDDGDAKDGLMQWRYYDPETGKEIPEEDYAAWGIKP